MLPADADTADAEASDDGAIKHEYVLTWKKFVAECSAEKVTVDESRAEEIVVALVAAYNYYISNLKVEVADTITLECPEECKSFAAILEGTTYKVLIISHAPNIVP